LRRKWLTTPERRLARYFIGEESAMIINEGQELVEAGLHLRVTAMADNCVQVECAGNVDAAALPAGSDLLARLLGADIYSRRVLLDFEKVEILDTGGITWLIESQKRFEQGGGRLVVHSLPPLACQVIKLLHVDRLVNIQPDLAAARVFARGGKP
jgi:anti-anti-sigma factor